MDKKNKARFTNEELSKKFKNNFDLVNYAISLAENMIKSGRDTRVKCDTQNRAMLILEEINQGKDEFDEIKDTGGPRPSQAAINGELQQQMIYEERLEKRKQQRIVDELEEEDDD